MGLAEVIQRQGSPWASAFDAYRATRLEPLQEANIKSEMQRRNLEMFIRQAQMEQDAERLRQNEEWNKTRIADTEASAKRADQKAYKDRLDEAVNLVGQNIAGTIDPATGHPHPGKLQALVTQVAQQYGLDPKVLPSALVDAMSGQAQQTFASAQAKEQRSTAAENRKEDEYTYKKKMRPLEEQKTRVDIANTRAMMADRTRRTDLAEQKAQATAKAKGLTFSQYVSARNAYVKEYQDPYSGNLQEGAPSWESYLDSNLATWKKVSGQPDQPRPAQAGASSDRPAPASGQAGQPITHVWRNKETKELQRFKLVNGSWVPM